MSEALSLREPETGLMVRREPATVLAEAQRAAAALRDVLASKAKKIIINGEQYLEFEDWSTCASFYNIAAGSDDAVPCEVEGVKGAKAVAYAIRTDTGLRISSAVAYCLRDEENWEEKPWFQLASMAQTRACAKALRNVLSRVVVLAGARATPAEEMMDGASRADVKTCPACGKAAIIKGKAEFGGGWVCFKKKGGCGWKGLDTYDWTKPMIESPAAPEPRPAAADVAPEAGLAAQAIGAGAEPSPLDAAWIKVKEAREAKQMSRDQVMALIGKTWPSLKTKGGEVDLTKMDLLMVQNLALLLGQE